MPAVYEEGIDVSVPPDTVLIPLPKNVELRLSTSSRRKWISVYQASEKKKVSVVVEERHPLTSVVPPEYDGYVKSLVCRNCERLFCVTADEYEVNETKFCRECSAFLLHVSSVSDCHLCFQRVAWIQSGQVKVHHLLNISWDIAACIVRSKVPQVDVGRLSFGAFLILDQVNKSAKDEDEEES